MKDVDILWCSGMARTWPLQGPWGPRRAAQISGLQLPLWLVFVRDLLLERRTSAAHQNMWTCFDIQERPALGQCRVDEPQVRPHRYRVCSFNCACPSSRRFNILLLAYWLFGRTRNGCSRSQKPVMMTKAVGVRFPGHLEEGVGAPSPGFLNLRMLRSNIEYATHSLSSRVSRRTG